MPEKTYGTVITSSGAALIAACILNGTKLPITDAAVGDGGGAYYQPTVAYVVVSLLTKEPPKEIEDMVDYAKRFEDAEATNTAVKAGVQISQENFSKIIRASKEAAPAAC